MNNELDKIFDNFDKNKIFKNKSLLQINYKPEEIPHRKEQIKQIASILAPVLRGERASNLFFIWEKQEQEKHFQCNMLEMKF